MSTPTYGTFCWHDCMTTDVEAAKKFYCELFGWTVTELEMGPLGTYHKISVGEREIGGFVPFPKEAGVPSHWIGYVTVDDVDAACQRADSAGGKTCVPPTDIPNIGRFAVITDPAGAVISPWASAQASPAPIPEGPAPAGTFCWEELHTSDTDQAKAFYGELFGWNTKEWPMGEMVYTIFTAGETDVGGTMVMPPEATARPNWLSYVLVDDVDQSVKQAQGLGATVNCEPRDIPGVGRFAVLADPTGASFAVYKSAPKS